MARAKRWKGGRERDALARLGTRGAICRGVDATATNVRLKKNPLPSLLARASIGISQRTRRGQGPPLLVHVGSAGDQTPLTRVERENCVRKQSQTRRLDSQVRDGTLKTVACRCLSRLPALFGGEVCSSQATVELGKDLTLSRLASSCACGLSRRAGGRRMHSTIASLHRLRAMCQATRYPLPLCTLIQLQLRHSI
jgi:hypothetical protein